MLREAGIEPVAALRGGMQGWVAAGYPVHTAAEGYDAAHEVCPICGQVHAV